MCVSSWLDKEFWARVEEEDDNIKDFSLAVPAQWSRPSRSEFPSRRAT